MNAIADKAELTVADLKIAQQAIWHAASIACLHPCIECPFLDTLEGTSQFSFGRHRAAEKRIRDLGGFPCHMAEGNEKAFAGAEAGPTKHQCRGWLNAGGTLEAFDRRYRSPYSEATLTAERSTTMILSGQYYRLSI